MNKFLHLIIAFILILNTSFGQGSFVLTTTEGEDVTNSTYYVTSESAADVILEAHINVQNNNASALDVVLKKIETNVLAGTSNTFCWGPNCYPPTTLESNAYNMGAGSIEETFHGDYTPGGNEGVSTITYVFFDQRNASDSSFVIVVFQAGAVDVADFVNTNFSFSKPYPNPADDYSSIEFSIDNNLISELTFYNVLGKEVEKIRISDQKGKVIINTADFNPGIYFYSFTMNNKVLNTGKLNVRK